MRIREGSVTWYREYAQEDVVSFEDILAKWAPQDAHDP